MLMTDFFEPPVAAWLSNRSMSASVSPPTPAAPIRRNERRDVESHNRLRSPKKFSIVGLLLSRWVSEVVVVGQSLCRAAESDG